MAPTIPSPHLQINPELLSAASFTPFGTVITSPLAPGRNTIPFPPPQSSQVVNRGTALKYPDVTTLESKYRLSPSGAPASPRISLFASFPQALRPTSPSSSTQVLDIRLLERHPYTTQTFIPLVSHVPQGQRKNRYLVVVAPTLPAPEPGVGLTPYFPQVTSVGYGDGGGLPDLKNIRAFLAEEGTAVTYGVGVWHAPMIVVGKGRIDFMVTQWMSGKEGEDCQEVDLGARNGEGIEILVDDEQNHRERAKL